MGNLKLPAEICFDKKRVRMFSFVPNHELGEHQLEGICQRDLVIWRRCHPFYFFKDPLVNMLEEPSHLVRLSLSKAAGKLQWIQ